MEKEVREFCFVGVFTGTVVELKKKGSSSVMGFCIFSRKYNEHAQTIFGG